MIRKRPHNGRTPAMHILIERGVWRVVSCERTADDVDQNGGSTTEIAKKARGLCVILCGFGRWRDGVDLLQSAARHR